MREAGEREGDGARAKGDLEEKKKTLVNLISAFGSSSAGRGGVALGAEVVACSPLSLSLSPAAEMHDMQSWCASVQRKTGRSGQPFALATRARMLLQQPVPK